MTDQCSPQHSLEVLSTLCFETGSPTDPENGSLLIILDSRPESSRLVFRVSTGIPKTHHYSHFSHVLGLKFPFSHCNESILLTEPHYHTLIFDYLIIGFSISSILNLTVSYLLHTLNSSSNNFFPEPCIPFCISLYLTLSNNTT